MNGEISEMINTITDFIAEFTRIKGLGFVETHRSGPTGIGKTLEDLLGIIENNEDGPDFGNYELKSYRINSNSMLTIFTKSPDVPRANSELLNLAGYSVGGRVVLHTTLQYGKTNTLPNGKTIGLQIEEDVLTVLVDGEPTNCYWNKSSIEKQVNKKYLTGELVYVGAESRGRGANEQFHFKEAFLCKGVDASNFFNLIKQGLVYIDIRMGFYRDGPNVGKVHDHGTGFRILPKYENFIFNTKKQIV